MSEIINNVIDTAKERLKNPFLGAFILSWIAFNWKAISYFILSDENIADRMETIETDYASWYSGLWFPLSFAVFYLLILPLIMLLFDWASKWVINKRKDHQNDLVLDDYDRILKVATKEFKIAEAKAGKRPTELLNKEIETLTNQYESTLQLLEQANESNANLSQRIQKIDTENKTIKKERDEAITEMAIFNNEITQHEGQIALNNMKDELRWRKDFQKFAGDSELRFGLFAMMESINLNIKLNDKVDLGLINKLAKLDLIKITVFGDSSIDHYEITEKGIYFIKRLTQIDIEKLEDPKF